MLRYLLIFAISLNANAAIFEINKDHSRVSYKIAYMSFSESTGSFSNYKGTVDFDAEKNNLIALSAVIEVASIDTLDIKRDAHLRKSDFFHVEKYPEINFTSRKVKSLKPNFYEVSGVLTIKGVSKDVVLLTEFKGQKKDHIGKLSLFFKATTEVNRKDFNILWNKSLDQTNYLLGDMVSIELIIQAQPIGKATSFAAHMIPSNKPLDKFARFKRGEIAKPDHLTHFDKQDAAPKESKGFAAPEVPTEDPNPYTWMQLIVGFVGFCLSIAVSYYLKLKFLSYLKVKNYSEGGMHSLLGDLFVIAVIMLYSHFYYRYLYP
jgi:polyisoprenoid-binding protein YceI